MMPEASPFWQNAFLFTVFLFTGWFIWSGWRAGVVRAALALGGMFVGSFAGVAVGGAIGPLVGRIFPVPGVFVGVLLGLAVGIGIYVAVWFLGALLFKRTGQQRTTVLRLIYGLGGAALGLFIAVTMLWGMLFFVRGLGGFYQGRFEPAALRDSRLPRPNFAETALVKLNRSIGAGRTGQRLLSLDLMPEKFYRLFEKFGQICAQPAALRRLLDYPPINALLDDPKITAFLNDPNAADALDNQSLRALLTNPKLAEAVNDPALIAKVQKIDLEKALDFALAAPSSSRESQHP
jgi:hypothetical protein